MSIFFHTSGMVRVPADNIPNLNVAAKALQTQFLQERGIVGVARDGHEINVTTAALSTFFGLYNSLKFPTMNWAKLPIGNEFYAFQSISVRVLREKGRMLLKYNGNLTALLVSSIAVPAVFGSIHLASSLQAPFSYRNLALSLTIFVAECFFLYLPTKVLNSIFLWITMRRMARNLARRLA